MVELARESWDAFWPEALPLMTLHHQELEAGLASRKASFEIDVERAKALDSAGVLVILAAREAGKLVGYCLWYLGYDLECKGLLTATQGPWFVGPEARSSTLGLRLFKESLPLLKALGVLNCFPHHWTKGAGARLESFFLRSGAEPLETVYSLWIGE